VNEDEFDSLRRWGDALDDDPRPEVRAAGKAILLLAAEVERLQLELWHARLGVSAETDHGDQPEPSAAGHRGALTAGLEGLPSVLARLTRRARRAESDRVEGSG
jgi:hypothetical protein